MRHTSTHIHVVKNPTHRDMRNRHTSLGLVENSKKEGISDVTENTQGLRGMHEVGESEAA